MLIAIAVILTLVFIGFLIWWGVKRKPIKAHLIMYLLSTLTGVYTLSFFLSMDIPSIVKILVSIVAGAILIFIAAWQQRRRESA